MDITIPLNGAIIQLPLNGGLIPLADLFYPKYYADLYPFGPQGQIIKSDGFKFFDALESSVERVGFTFKRPAENRIFCSPLQPGTWPFTFRIKRITSTPFITVAMLSGNIIITDTEQFGWSVR